MDVKYPEINVRLIGTDGNAFAVMAEVRQALHQANVSKEEIKKYVHEATSGDYDHLLQTTMRWVKVS